LLIYLVGRLSRALLYDYSDYHRRNIMPNLCNWYPDGYYGQRIKIDPLYIVDICYMDSNTGTVAWCTDPAAAIVGLLFEPETFEDRIKDRKLGSGYYAIDHIRRKTVGGVWPFWNDLATELLNRGLALPVEKPPVSRRKKPKGFG
jgi:hypothetical protein